MPWKPEESLSFLELALNGDPSEGEQQEKYLNAEIESSDNYVVVFKEEATTQDGEPVLPIHWVILYINCCLAVESHKEMVKQMSSPGKIKYEYEIGNDFRGYSASMTEQWVL